MVQGTQPCYRRLLRSNIRRMFASIRNSLSPTSLSKPAADRLEFVAYLGHNHPYEIIIGPYGYYEFIMRRRDRRPGTD